ncbi:hypothetical protein ACEZDB_25455 [Streptacidiphilus sp. N1-3]|uniref:Uncharacterized protein n=1 Tax=Streptacidiphilus alkalitolerans TaxID=3342712 RepID=A0ABV6X6U7_9ACTN
MSHVSPSGFERLVNDEYERLQRFLAHLGATPEGAEEIADRAFASLLREGSRSSGQRIERPLDWVLITAWRTYCREERRSRKRGEEERVGGLELRLVMALFLEGFSTIDIARLINSTEQIARTLVKHAAEGFLSPEPGPALRPEEGGASELV